MSTTKPTDGLTKEIQSLLYNGVPVTKTAPTAIRLINELDIPEYYRPHPETGKLFLICNVVSNSPLTLTLDTVAHTLHEANTKKLNGQRIIRTNNAIDYVERVRFRTKLTNHYKALRKEETILSAQLALFSKSVSNTPATHEIEGYKDLTKTALDSIRTEINEYVKNNTPVLDFPDAILQQCKIWHEFKGR
jgi:hypothetical protein